MHDCLTIHFLPEFSGCLVEKPSCQFAVRCGFSYHCHHPNHRDFHTTIHPSEEGVDLAKRYQALRESRRLEYFEQLKAKIPADLLEEELELLLTPKS